MNRIVTGLHYQPGPIPTRRPQPVTPPRHGPPLGGPPKHGPPIGGNPKPKPKPKGPPAKTLQQKALNTALGAIKNALTETGVGQNQALHYAKVLLSQKGVEIEKNGQILYKGRQYQPSAFASSNLAQYVTGAAAQARNQKAITTDPGYLQALATLGLTRDTTISPLRDSERQALIQFGDPNLVQNDAATAGATAANPFSTLKLLQLQNARQLQATQQNANMLGTYHGGGYQSGVNEDQRVNAANNQDAQIKIQNLLSSLNQQIGAANQAYNVGQSGAQLDAYNNLLASGAIHAAGAPNLGVGAYQYKGFNQPSGATPLPPRPTPPGYPGSLGAVV